MTAGVSPERIRAEQERAKQWYENAPSLADRKEFRDGCKPKFNNSSEQVPDTIDSFPVDEEALKICKAVIWGEVEENDIP